MLSRANAIFADRTLDVFPAFQNAVTDRLGADFKQFDFTDRNTVDLINTWISDATNRVIPKLLDSLDPDERLVLASALYYRGEWKQAFDSDNTVQAPFFPETGDPVDVAFMQSGNYPALFYEDENFSAVELRYESGRSADNFALRLILPEKNMAAQDALEKIRSTPALLGDLAAAKYGKGIIRLPRFRLEGSTDVLPLLQEHGFSDVLASDAAFAGVASPAPRLERMIQAAQLTVDESGTEAGAATAAIFSTRSGIAVENSFEITLDRPFALALRNISSGELLFVGWVANPGAL